MRATADGRGAEEVIGMNDEKQRFAQEVFNAVRKLNEAMAVAGKADIRVDLDVTCIGTIETPDLKMLLVSVYLKMKPRGCR